MNHELFAFLNDATRFIPPTFIQFVNDMERAGFDPFLYHGRWYYVGPAVRTDIRSGIGLQDIMRATTVAIGYESCGKNDYVCWSTIAHIGTYDEYADDDPEEL